MKKASFLRSALASFSAQCLVRSANLGPGRGGANDQGQHGNRRRRDDEIPVPPSPPQAALEQPGTTGQDRLVVHEQPQVDRELLGRRVSVRRILRNGLQDNRFQVTGDRGVEPGGKTGSSSAI